MKNSEPILPTNPFDPRKLQLFFSGHLNRIYCAKSHLVERLHEIQSQTYFKDLKNAVTETLEDVERQITRMDEIYINLEIQYSLESNNGMVGMIEESYNAIYDQPEEEMRDLAILFYLQNIESVETSSFKFLQVIAKNLKNKQIEQLLQENYDSAIEDRALLVVITKKYLSN